MKNLLFRIALPMAVCVTAVSVAQAQLSITPPEPLAIPDGGTLNLQFPETQLAIQSVDQINLTMLHTWVGDLTVKVIAPSGAEFILFDRPGSLSFPDSGYSSNLGMDNDSADAPTVPATYSFASLGMNFETAADIGTQAEVDSSQVYQAKTWVTGPFGPGTWMLSITDSVPDDVGFFSGAEIQFTPVPEPAMTGVAVAFLLVGAVGVRRWKTRQNLSVTE